MNKIQKAKKLIAEAKVLLAATFNKDLFSKALKNPKVKKIAQAHIKELESTLSDVLEDYIDTKGLTDWVVTEEELDYQIMKAFGRSLDDTPEESTQHVNCYYAAFYLVSKHLKAKHGVPPVTWFVRDVLKPAGLKL